MRNINKKTCCLLITLFALPLCGNAAPEIETSYRRTNTEYDRSVNTSDYQRVADTSGSTRGGSSSAGRNGSSSGRTTEKSNEDKAIEKIKAVKKALKQSKISIPGVAQLVLRDAAPKMIKELQEAQQLSAPSLSSQFSQVYQQISKLPTAKQNVIFKQINVACAMLDNLINGVKNPPANGLGSGNGGGDKRRGGGASGGSSSSNYSSSGSSSKQNASSSITIGDRPDAKDQPSGSLGTQGSLFIKDDTGKPASLIEKTSIQVGK